MSHEIEAFFMIFIEVAFLDGNQTKYHATYDVEYRIFWDLFLLVDRCIENGDFDSVFSKDK